MDLSAFPMPDEGFVVTQYLTVKDAIVSAKYYAEVFGGKLLHEGRPSIVILANSFTFEQSVKSPILPLHHQKI